MITVQEVKPKLLWGKEGKNNDRVMKSLLSGPKSAYEVHKTVEEKLEYSTSNRRLRDLTDQGYLVRLDQSSKARRNKILYGFSTKGAVASLIFADNLTETD